MYGSGTGVLGLTIAAGGTTVGGAQLARTGFPAVGLTLIAIACLVGGFALFRLAVRRAKV